MAQPGSLEEFQWLREQGVQVIVCLAEDAPRRSWINDAGLFSVHMPIEDMQPPTQEQIDQFLAAVEKANAKKLGVAVHCTAGLGRTGAMIACWFVAQGMSARDAIARARRLRPGSIETEEQEEAIVEFARRRKMEAESDLP